MKAFAAESITDEELEASIERMLAERDEYKSLETCTVAKPQ